MLEGMESSVSGDKVLLDHHETAAFVNLRRWAQDSSGFIHPYLRFVPVVNGTAVQTPADLPQNTVVLSCPCALAITPSVSALGLQALFKEYAIHGSTLMDNGSVVSTWTERMLLCSYVVAHWVARDCGSLNRLKALRHMPYIDTLPPYELLLTSLNFNTDEMPYLRGTNLFAATNARMEDLVREHEKCLVIFQQCSKVTELYTFERYLTAAIHLSSRAFPSSLLSPVPTLTPSPESPAYPVLLPILDCLNHGRGQPVTWLVDQMTNPKSSSSHRSAPNTSIGGPSHSHGSSASLSISLVTGAPVRSGAEVLNNYGAKPNSELILGYGFSIPKNPDDTIVLQLGGSLKKWEIGRKSSAGYRETVGGLVEEAFAMVSAPAANGREQSGQESSDDLQEIFEAKLDAAEFLLQAVNTKLAALPQVTAEAPKPEIPAVRQAVWDMIVHYVEGQRSCLLDLTESLESRLHSISDEMSSLGLQIEYEDDP